VPQGHGAIVPREIYRRREIRNPVRKPAWSQVGYPFFVRYGMLKGTVERQAAGRGEGLGTSTIFPGGVSGDPKAISLSQPGTTSISAQALAHLQPLDGGTGKLSPPSRTLTPEGKPFGDAFRTRFLGQRKIAHTMSPLTVVRVRQSTPCSWHSAANQVTPSRALIRTTQYPEGPTAARHAHSGYEAANFSSRVRSLVASQVQERGKWRNRG
jgi:hypothetical protein